MVLPILLILHRSAGNRLLVLPEETLGAISRKPDGAVSQEHLPPFVDPGYALCPMGSVSTRQRSPPQGGLRLRQTCIPLGFLRALSLWIYWRLSEGGGVATWHLGGCSHQHGHLSFSNVRGQMHHRPEAWISHQALRGQCAP